MNYNYKSEHLERSLKVFWTITQTVQLSSRRHVVQLKSVMIFKTLGKKTAKQEL